VEERDQSRFSYPNLDIEGRVSKKGERELDDWILKEGSKKVKVRKRIFVLYFVALVIEA